jgi:uncharacterized spore protein YtfJ
MEPTAVLEEAKNVFTVKRVVGDPYEKNGVTLIPVASIGGGGGGGTGNSKDGQGTGGGLGISVRPLGVYFIKGDSVRWIPSIDATRVILGGQLVAIVAMLVLRSLARNRTRRAIWRSKEHIAERRRRSEAKQRK